MLSKSLQKYVFISDSVSFDLSNRINSKNSCGKQAAGKTGQVPGRFKLYMSK